MEVGSMKRKARCKYCNKEVAKSKLVMTCGELTCKKCCGDISRLDIKDGKIVIVWNASYKKMPTVSSYENLGEMVKDFEDNLGIAGGHIDRLELLSNGREYGLILHKGNMHYNVGYIVGGIDKLGSILKTWKLEELVEKNELAKETDNLKITPVFVPGGYCVAYKILIKSTGDVTYKPVGGFESVGLGQGGAPNVLR